MDNPLAPSLAGMSTWRGEGVHTAGDWQSGRGQQLQYVRPVRLLIDNDGQSDSFPQMGIVVSPCRCMSDGIDWDGSVRTPHPPWRGRCQKQQILNHQSTEIFNWNFQSLKVVSLYCDPQLQVTKNYSDLYKFVTTFTMYRYENWLHKCEENQRKTSMVSVVDFSALGVNLLFAPFIIQAMTCPARGVTY